MEGERCYGKKMSYVHFLQGGKEPLLYTNKTETILCLAQVLKREVIFQDEVHGIEFGVIQ